MDAPYNEPSKNSIDGNMQIILSSAYLGLTRLSPGFLYLNDQGLFLYTVGLCLCTEANTGSSLEVCGSVWLYIDIPDDAKYALIVRFTFKTEMEVQEW